MSYESYTFRHAAGTLSGPFISAMCGESTLIAVYPDRGNVKKEGIKA